MKSTKKGIVLALSLAAVQVGIAAAEPSYLVYPAAPAVFRYDTSRYELIGTDQVKFDPGYAIANEMLWDRIEGRVPVEIYRAPQLMGFEPTSGTSEFVVYRSEFDIVVDGFGPAPRTLGNLCLRFWPQPAAVSVVLTVDGQPTDRLTMPLAAIEVVTPVESGFYADTRTYHFSWVGSSSMQIIAFSDKNANGAFEGSPAYRIVARDATIPVAPITWGGVKALYR